MSSIPSSFDPLATTSAIILPPGYTRLEYITIKPDSTWRGIETDIIPINEGSLRMIFYVSDYYEYAQPFSAYFSETARTQRVLMLMDNRLYGYFNGIAGSVENFRSKAYNVDWNEWHDVILKPETMILDKIQYDSGGINEGQTVVPFKLGYMPYPLQLKVKLFEQKNELKSLHKLVPALNPQNQECLYDIIGQKEYKQ